MKQSKMKPIHKFNGGRGATLCHKCNRMISEGMIDELYCEEHGGKPTYKYKLIRSSDNLIVTGNKILWLEWNENGTYKEHHETPVVGASLVVDPHYGTYRWLTTTMNSFTEEEGVVNFETKNSKYQLIKY